MNRILYNITTMLIAPFLVFAAEASSAKQTEEQPKAAYIASPEYYSKLFENDKVLVLKMVLKPGEADNLHHHNNETVYFQQGGKARITKADGNAIEADIPDGHVMWYEAWSHQVTNIGDTEIIAIIVEDKPQISSAKK